MIDICNLRAGAQKVVAATSCASFQNQNRVEVTIMENLPTSCDNSTKKSIDFSWKICDRKIDLFLKQKQYPEAMDEIAVLYHQPLTRYIQSLSHLAPDDIADTYQEVMLTACKKLPKFEGRSHLFTWLCGIAYRRIMDSHRSRKNRARLLDENLDRIAGAAPQQPCKTLLQKEVLEIFLANLSQREREILELRHIEECSQTEVAKKLGICEMTVRRAEKRFKQLASSLINP